MISYSINKIKSKYKNEKKTTLKNKNKNIISKIC
jgi:hypothetical protein